MTYALEFSKQASKDIDLHKKSGNKVVLRKLLVLLQELAQDPYIGTGKPEALKHELSGYCLEESIKNTGLFIKC